MSEPDDYTEDDRYDWDRDDPRQYCRHGTFIGSWWGPDLLCIACELGDDEPEPLARARVEHEHEHDKEDPDER